MAVRPFVRSHALEMTLWLCEMAADFLDDPKGKEKTLTPVEQRRIRSAMYALQNYSEDGVDEIQKPVATMLSMLDGDELSRATRHDIGVTVRDSAWQLKDALEIAVNGDI